MSTENTITIKDEFIRLGQAMKLSDLVQSGAEAKMVIIDGEVTVNGEVCTERGKKLRDGDEFSFDGRKVRVVSDAS
ncbi:MAG: RNA-binding S4 domain-containing protein [Lachnospiraceae bacterium]|nr:RNA-binding S4 domain-containing protein [Lachnospiraceae bacterium]